MKGTSFGATVLAACLALVGCGGEPPPGPQPAFSDGGLPSGPAGSRWSETANAAGGDIESTEAGLATTVAYSQLFSVANVGADADYHVTTKNFTAKVNQLGVGGRCLTRNPSPTTLANFVTFLRDYDTGAIIASGNLYCDGRVNTVTSFATVKPGHRLYITASTLNSRAIPYDIWLAAYQRQ